MEDSSQAQTQKVSGTSQAISPPIRNIEKVGDEIHSLSQPGQQHESTNAGTNVKAYEQQQKVGAMDGSVATGVGKSTANYDASDDGYQNADTIMDSASLLKNHQIRQPSQAVAANQSDATGTISYLQGNLAQDSSAFTRSKQHQAVQSIEQEESIQVGFGNVTDPQLNSRQSNGRPSVNQNEEDGGQGLTNRELKPKYSHRKNNQHHMSKLSGNREKQVRGGANLQVISQDRVAAKQKIGLLTQQQLYVDPQRNAQPIGLTQEILPFGIKGDSMKKNSVDQIRLSGMLDTQQSSERTKVIQKTTHNSFKQEVSTFHEQNSQNKTINMSSDRSRLRLNKNAKLHELSRQTLQKQQETSQMLQKQILPDITFDQQMIQGTTLRDQSTEKLGIDPTANQHHQNSALTGKFDKHHRLSVTQLKRKNDIVMKVHNNTNQLNQTLNFIEPKRKQNVILPKVQNSSAQRSSSSSMMQLKKIESSHKIGAEMLIDDYDINVKSFNKISIKDNARSRKQSLQHNSKQQMKRLMRDEQNSAIRISKRQQNKFNMNASLDSIQVSDEGSPLGEQSYRDGQQQQTQSIYHSHNQPQSAMIQGLISSQMSAIKVNTKKQNYNSTERISQQASFLHGESTTASQPKTTDLMVSSEIKRIRKAEEATSIAEMKVTSVVNDKKLKPKDIDLLLSSYTGGLQQTIAMVNPKNANYSAELQQFVANACSGIEQASILRQTLLQEQIEKFEKYKQQLADSKALDEKRMNIMKKELSQRPFQKNFDRSEDILTAIEEMEKQAEEQEEMGEVLEKSYYSGAHYDLERVANNLQAVQALNISNITVSYIDESLFEKKDENINGISEEIKQEGDNAMRHVAKRVLNKFWRHYTTNDVSSQTEEKVIDALKSQLFQTQQQITQLKETIIKYDTEKQQLEFNLDTEKKMHELTKRNYSEKQNYVEELEDQKKQLFDQIQDFKDRSTDFTARFKLFADEIGNLKLEVHGQNQVIKQNAEKLSVKIQYIDDLEDQIKRIKANVSSQAASALSLKTVAQADFEEEVKTQQSLQKPASKKEIAQVASKKKLQRDSSQKKMVKNSSQKKLASPKRAAPEVATKMSKEAEDKLRKDIQRQVTQQVTEDVERTAKKQAREEAQAEAEQKHKKALEALEIKNNATIKVKSKKIESLEEQVGQRDHQLKEMYKKIEELKQLDSSRSKIQASAQNFQSEQKNTDQKINDLENQKQTKKLKAKEDVDQVQQAKDTSQQKVRPPKLDAITRKDEITKKTTLVKQSPKKAHQKSKHVSDLELLQGKNEMEIETTLIIGQAESTDEEVVEDTNKTERLPTPQMLNVSTQSGMDEVSEHQQVFTPTKSRKAGSQIQTPRSEIEDGSIPRTLQSKQANKRSAKQPSDYQSAKRYDSADLQDALKVEKITHRNQSISSKSIEKLDYHNRKSSIDKVSQGSQVETGMLQKPLAPETRQAVSSIHASQQQNDLDDNASGLYSNKMIEKYNHGQAKQENLNQAQQQSPIDYVMPKTTDDTFFDRKLSQGESLQQNHVEQHYSIVGRSILDNHSAQTLYRPEVRNRPDNIAPKQSLVGKLYNQIQKQPSLVDPPENLFLESRQYKIKQQANVTFGYKPQFSGENQQEIHGVLDQDTLKQGAQMLSDLGEGPRNQKLEQYQKILSKAYAPEKIPASILLEQAKESMDGTELKLLMLMLQMRGQFDRKGGTMVTKASQTDGLLVQTSISAQMQQMQQEIVNLNLIDKRLSQLTETDDEAEHETIHLVDSTTKVSQILTKQQTLVQSKVSLKGPGVEIGVQADDNLIKVANDRVHLIEKSRHMFFGKNTQSGDQYTRMGGEFSPESKRSKQPAVLRAQLLGDSNKNDKFMAPTMRQQQLSAIYEHEKQRALEQAQKDNAIYLRELEQEQIERLQLSYMQQMEQQARQQSSHHRVNLDLKQNNAIQSREKIQTENSGRDHRRQNIGNEITNMSSFKDLSLAAVEYQNSMDSLGVLKKTLQQRDGEEERPKTNEIQNSPERPQDNSKQTELSKTQDASQAKSSETLHISVKALQMEDYGTKDGQVLDRVAEELQTEGTPHNDRSDQSIQSIQQLTAVDRNNIDYGNMETAQNEPSQRSKY